MVNLPEIPGAARIVSVEHIKEGGRADVTLYVPEINIHSDVEISSSFAMVTFADFNNHFSNFGFSNGQFIEFTIEHSGESITRKYAIQTIKALEDLENGRKYEVMCVSPLRYVSNYAKVSKSFFATPSDIAAEIYANHTDEPIFHWEPSITPQQIVIPSWDPIKAIKWLGRRSQSTTSNQCFSFFQDSRQRFSFMSLPKAREIYSSNTITYRYNPSLDMENGVPNTQAEMTRILNLKYINAFDIRKAIDKGQMSNTAYYVDFTLKSLDIWTNTYWDTYAKDAMNPRTLFFQEDMFPGKVTYSNVATSSNNLPNDNNSTNPIEEGYGDYYHQQIEIIVNGNPVVEIAQIINIEIPSLEPMTQQSRFELDNYWSGRYMVLAKRDRFTGDGHRMVLRLGKDSMK